MRYQNQIVFIIMLAIAVIVYVFSHDFFLAFYSFAGLMMFYFGFLILTAFMRDKKKKR